MKPTREELLPYIDNRKDAAKLYGVSEKTIIRWMQHHKIYKPRPNFGHSKLNMDKAQEIRREHKQGKSVKELASQYDVTVSTIGRVLNNVIYKESTDVAEVSVVYNINVSSDVSAFCHAPSAAGILSGGKE